MATLSEIIKADRCAKYCWEQYHKGMPGPIQRDGALARGWCIGVLSQAGLGSASLMREIDQCDLNTFVSTWDRCYHDAYGPT